MPSPSPFRISVGMHRFSIPQIFTFDQKTSIVQRWIYVGTTSMIYLEKCDGYPTSMRRLKTDVSPTLGLGRYYDVGFTSVPRR